MIKKKPQEEIKKKNIKKLSYSIEDIKNGRIKKEERENKKKKPKKPKKLANLLIKLFIKIY